jgi:hypothetical protein
MAAGFLVAGAADEIFTLFPGELAREFFYGALALTIAAALQHLLAHGKD